MPDLRAVVPAVLLGEVAPADTSDQNESSPKAESTMPPEAVVSENGDADPGEGCFRWIFSVTVLHLDACTAYTYVMYLRT